MKMKTLLSKIRRQTATAADVQCNGIIPRSLIQADESPYKKVRLKEYRSVNKSNIFIIKLYLQLFICLCFTIISVFGNNHNHNHNNINNNRPPKFLLEGQSEIVIRLKEGAESPIGLLIYQLKGYDPDGDSIVFGIRNTFDSDVIHLENYEHNNTANIYLNKELDRELKDEYSIVLTLTDNRLGEGNFVTQSFLLLVEDINDNEPIFKPYQSALEVPENSRPGILTTLEATDRDEGAYGQVVYYLQELEGDTDVFSIVTHQGKGIIRLIKSLDYERKNLYQLRVLAIDRANQGPINTGTAAILVKVKDIEDQPPVFSAVTPVTRIPENSPIGTQILQVKAHDGDRGINNPIQYSIIKNIDDGSNELFAINEFNGQIYTVKELDREDPKNLQNGAYILEILATERSMLKPPPSVKTEITIILTDINDETPTFRNRMYEAEINENAQENTPLNFIGENRMNGVYDYDQGNNGTFILSMEPNNDLFEITPKRAINEATFLIRIKNNNQLDYESVSKMNFTLIAKEIVANGKWSSVPITIHIRDSNDNFPEFEKNVYIFSIPENSPIDTVIGQVTANDKDSGIFGTAGIRYTNLGGSISHLLNLDEKTGLISIKSIGQHEFDREIISSHYLTVEARDELGEGNRNTVQIVLVIEDVNDNPPIFLERKYETRLLENKLTFETGPLLVKARDADLHGTENSEIKYEIINGEYMNNFTIDSKTGEIQPMHPMDFEIIRTNEIMNNNNNNSRGSNQNHQYTNIKIIYLIVGARDLGTPSLTTDVPVIIYLYDVNDWSPEFEKQVYSTSIYENLPGGSAVIKLTAMDKDGSSPNNQIVYRIQNGASDKFIINSETGLISIANGAILDPDLTDPKTFQYSLLVIALDGGLGDEQRRSSAIVNITIIDVNNKVPTFMEPEKITLLENTAVGTMIYQLIANDLDSNAMLRYHLYGNISEARSEEGILIKQTEYNYMNSFELNSMNGIIKVIKIIDREKVEQIKLGFYVEDIAAANGQQISMGFITIIIEDVNDNNPKFRKPFYKRSITENSQNGVTVANIVAFDIDKNRTITYSLEGSDTIIDLVNLDRDTGEIVVANKIDHEIHQWLNYTIRATDSGYPPRSSLVDLFVRVIDENDNNPYFIGDTKEFEIYENSPIGTRISVIEATDADSGDYGKITFLIDKISSQGKFSIDADTGVLIVADKIDREIKSAYTIVIEAWDNYQFGYTSGESRNAFKQFFIKILDENDSPPILHIPKNIVQISEYHNIMEIIINIKVTDDDDPNTLNGQVNFALEGGEGYFEIIQRDFLTADIYASTSLQNHYGNYTLNVIAKDLGKPQNIAESKLYINVIDYNDHAPIFVTPLQNATIRILENATIGAHVIQVHAIDNDDGANAAVLYRLKQDSMGHFRTFSIDQLTGLITLKMPLDRERQKVYEIRVEAYDQGIPTPLSTDLDLTIYVRNVNDYEPQFIVDEITVNFTEHRKPGMEKIKLPDTIDRDEVDDLDDPPSTVCYFIVFGNENQLFELDPVMHILTVLKELDRESKGNHTLIIKATENCVDPPAPINLTSLTRLTYQSSPLISRTMKMNQLNGDDQGKYLYDRYKHTRHLRSSNENIYDRENIEILSNPDNIDEPNNTDNNNNTDDNVMINFHSSKFKSLVTNVLKQDGTLVSVFINILDINDHAPEFITKVFTGGVTTAGDFGSTILHLEANDKDIGENALITYYQIGDIHKTLAEGLDHLQKAPFLVDRKTGAILLNFDPQKGMKGYFDFMVIANDTDGLRDSAHVFIYLLREDQRVKFVLRQQPVQVREQIHAFREILQNVTQSIVNIDDFKIHENQDGSVDKTKTDLYMHLVNRRDNSILEVSDVLRLLDENIEKLDNLFKDFNVLDTQPSEPLFLASELNDNRMLVWLIFSNLFIGAMFILVLIMCFSQKRNYKRELRAACVYAYGSSSPLEIVNQGVAATVPNTNKHSIEGSNPIWLKSYANEWFKNDDNLSGCNVGGGGGGAGIDTSHNDNINHHHHLNGYDHNGIRITDGSSEIIFGPDSLDENCLSADDHLQNADEKQKCFTINGGNDLLIGNNLTRSFNVYQQIDKMTHTSQLLTKKLETTEL